MVQGVLKRCTVGDWRRLGLCIVVAAGVGVPAYAGKVKIEKHEPEPPPGPELLLAGGSWRLCEPLRPTAMCRRSGASSGR